jgi:uncharacterized protein with GYD domain
LLGGAIGMASGGEEAPGTLESVLPAPQARPAAAHVLYVEEPASLDQHAARLRQGARLVLDGAEDECCDDGVEAAVVEWQVLGGGFDHGGIPGVAGIVRQTLSKALGHVGIWFGHDQLGHGIRVVLEVVPGARAQLEDPAGGRGQQLVAHLGQARALGPGGNPVIEAREDWVPTHAVIISLNSDARVVWDHNICTEGRKVKESGPTQGQATSRGETMPTFVMLTNLTAEGVKTLKNNPTRIQEVNKEVEQLGVKVKDQWATLGQYDFITIVEAPDDKTMAKVSVELGSRGTMSSQTLAAIPVEEFASAL